MRLSGRVALVTGAGKGIGKAIAIELAQQGAKVVVHYNSSDAGAIDTQKQIIALGGEALLCQADVGDGAQIQALVSAVMQHYAGIDILVNNAALQKNMTIFDYDEMGYDRIMNVNVRGYFQCIQAVFPHMQKQHFGRIINISSVHAKRPTDFDPVYAMSKGAIKMLTRESALEFARFGITVNAIEPGYIEIGTKSGHVAQMTTTQRQPESVNLQAYPTGRIGMPEDVAHLVTYIASEQSGHLTGSSIRLDGGSLLT